MRLMSLPERVNVVERLRIWRQETATEVTKEFLERNPDWLERCGSRASRVRTTTREEPRLGLESAPVLAQGFQQDGTEQGAPIFRPLPARIWTTIFRLSMSLTFNRASSLRRVPVA
jgi:hypothetical protein